MSDLANRLAATLRHLPTDVPPHRRLEIAAMLDGDAPGRLIKARDIVTVVAMLGARRELDARIAAIQERIGDRERVSAALVDSGVGKSVADWTARIAVDALADALADAGRL